MHDSPVVKQHEEVHYEPTLGHPLVAHAENPHTYYPQHSDYSHLERPLGHEYHQAYNANDSTDLF